MPDWSRRKLRSYKNISWLHQPVYGGYKTDHPVHETNESPESYSIVLLNGVNRSQKIAHALDIAKVTIVFIICEKHVFHLLKVDVGADLCEW